MPLMEDGYFKLGNVLSPITSSTANSLLQDVDPVIYNLLEYYAGVIDLHMGARWDAEVTAAGLTDLVGYTVAEKIPFDPLPWMGENQFKFPLLAIYRKEGTSEWHTTQSYHKNNIFHILWIMPALSAGQAERLMPFRTHVTNIIIDRTVSKYDSNYSGGVNPFSSSGVHKISIDKDVYGNVPDLSSNLYFPTVLLEGEIVESRSTTTLNYEDFDGVDGYVYVGEDIDPDVDIADFKEDF